MDTDWYSLLLVAQAASNKQENIGERHKLHNIAFNVEQILAILTKCSDFTVGMID